jgi:acyl-CoA synthetase (AMP-forming)/AMP-acid ligase II
MRMTSGMILKSLLEPRDPGSAAISASGRADLTYGLFAALCEETAVALRVRGLQRNDKLAIVLLAAAVVLHEGASAGERDLQDFANERLAAFKVPKRIVILDEIPKGATGKLQRIGLAQKLGLA